MSLFDREAYGCPRCRGTTRYHLSMTEQCRRCDERDAAVAVGELALLIGAVMKSS